MFKILTFLIFAIFSISGNSRDYHCKSIFDPNVVQRICYLSLNNEEERRRLDDIFRAQGIKAEVIELLSPGENPAESLKKNIEKLNQCKKESGQKVCDTMVISGHHDGAFRGDLIDGPLYPEDLLMMSCDYPDFFQGINSLYLQACNSMDEQLRPIPSELKKRSKEEEKKIAKEIAQNIPRAPGSRENPDYQNTTMRTLHSS